MYLNNFQEKAITKVKGSILPIKRRKFEVINSCPVCNKCRLTPSCNTQYSRESLLTSRPSFWLHNINCKHIYQFSGI